jgi:hypothetical protein
MNTAAMEEAKVAGAERRRLVDADGRRVAAVEAAEDEEPCRVAAEEDTKRRKQEEALEQQRQADSAELRRLSQAREQEAEGRRGKVEAKGQREGADAARGREEDAAAIRGTKQAEEGWRHEEAQVEAQHRANELMRRPDEEEAAQRAAGESNTNRAEAAVESDQTVAKRRLERKEALPVAAEDGDVEQRRVVEEERAAQVGTTSYRLPRHRHTCRIDPRLFQCRIWYRRCLIKFRSTNQTCPFRESHRPTRGQSDVVAILG